MKNKKKKLSMSLSVLIIGFLVGTSSLNTLDTNALVEQNNNHYTTDFFDRFTWKWNTTEVVSTESISQSNAPSLAVDTLGNVHIAWHEYTGDYDIFYKRWDDSSHIWTTTEVVSTESTGYSLYPSLAVDSSGNVHIAWEDWTDYAGAGTDGDIFYKQWNASSSTWTTTEVVSTESTGYSSEPSLAVDSTSNIHIAWHDATDYAGSGSDTDIFYKQWNASSSSWTTTEVVSTESSDSSWRPSLAVDSTSNIHIAWDDWTGPDWDIFYKRWDDSTSMWTTTEVVSTESSDRSNAPSLAVDSAGNVHIAWEDWTDYAGSGGDYDIFYKHWDASLMSWTTSEVVSTESTRDSYCPSLAVDSAGNVHIAWEDWTDYARSGGDYDIFYKRWDSYPSLWTTAEVISIESSGSFSDSLYPSLAVDSSGNVHITWEDYTNYAGSGTDWDIFYKLLSGLPLAPELAFIFPNPTELTTVNLDWNNVLGATSYHVYRSTSYIWSVEGLTPIATVSSSEYIDTVSSEGFYYYVIVAENFVGNSSHSNCQYVEYKLPHLREFSIVTGLILASFVLVFVVTRIRKRNSKPN